jgi:GLPGLI family protein
MKRTIIILLALVSFKLAYAQISGKVFYDEKMKLEIHVDDTNPQMFEGMPKEHTLKKVLYFNSDASLYESDKSNNEEQKLEQQDDSGARIVIDMQVPDDKMYTDLKSHQKVELRDFMSRKFLIESDITKIQWKLTGKQKKILDYPCQEAVLQDTSKKLVVWFTSAITVSTGPSGYGNLPGLILEAEMDNGRFNVLANKVELTEIDKSKLVKPKGGKKVSKEEFNKIVDEKRKEMMGENGGDGNVIIKIRN